MTNNNEGDRKITLSDEKYSRQCNASMQGEVNRKANGGNYICTSETERSVDHHNRHQSAHER